MLNTELSNAGGNLNVHGRADSDA